MTTILSEDAHFYRNQARQLARVLREVLEVYDLRIAFMGGAMVTKEKIARENAETILNKWNDIEDVDK